MRSYNIFVFFLLIIMVLGVIPTRAQEQYFTDESDVRLPDTVVWSMGADVGDIDGDADWDVCVATTWGPNGMGPCYLLVNDGLGYFTSESNTRLPFTQKESAYCVFGDIERDGDLDLYVCNLGTGFHREDDLYLNNGDGIFEDVTTERLPYHENETLDAGFADFTEDLFLDILVQGFSHYMPGTRLLENNGSGYFFDITEDHLPPDLFDNNHIAIGDIDNDLDLDVIESCYDNDHPLYFWARLLKNLGGGYFSDGHDDQLPTNLVRHIVLGDIDLDGDLDALTSIGGYVGIWINDGTGYYTDETAQRLPEDERSGESHLAFGDFDNDGDLDFFLGATTMRYPHLYINDGLGYFTNGDERLPDSRQSVYWVEPFDADQDGDLDIFLACSGLGRQKIFINQSSPDTIPPNVLINTILAGQVDSEAVFPIYISAWDNISVAIGELNGILHYRVNGEDFIDLQMLPLGGTFFGERIPCQPGGTTVDYYIELIDRMGNTTLLPPDAPDSVFSFVVSGPVSVENQEDFSINNDGITGFPNPFNSSITLTIILPKGGDVSLSIYDLNGSLVKILKEEGFLQGGEYKYNWDAKNITDKTISTGFYFARLKTPYSQKTLRLLFLR